MILRILIPVMMILLSRIGAALAADLDAKCREIARDYPQVATIGVDSLSHWLSQDQGPHPLLIDVRDLDEYEHSHLRNAVRVVDPDSLRILLNARANTRAVLYCSVGLRSAKLVDQLQKEFPGRLFNLEGSIFAWANAGYPVYNDSLQVRTVHGYNWLWRRYLEEEYRR